MTKRIHSKAGVLAPAADIAAAAQRVLEAITTETAVYQLYVNEEGEAAERVCDAAGDAVSAAMDALLAIPKADVLDDMSASGRMDYVRALALIQRRFLVMESDYQSIHSRPECLLVDLLLDGTPAGDVPLLWHVSGDPRSSRPSDAELQAAWGDHNRQEAA